MFFMFVFEFMFLASSFTLTENGAISFLSARAIVERPYYDASTCATARISFLLLVLYVIYARSRA
jgi:hypothetical protein